GPQGTVSAKFAGDTLNSPASVTASTLVFAYLTGGGSFVIGDLSAKVGAGITFWGAHWAKSNSLSAGSAPSSFKGFADQVNSDKWVSSPGNSSNPPSTVPTYMAVVVSGSSGKSGASSSGEIAKSAIPRTSSIDGDQSGLQ